ncbi:MAG: hypothetical protein R2849_12265 [Thermomicrobiales bacterium]
MACGTAVVSSGRTSLAEVVGDAGLVIEPTRQGVAEGILKLANDTELRAGYRPEGWSVRGVFLGGDCRSDPGSLSGRNRVGGR